MNLGPTPYLEGVSQQGLPLEVKIYLPSEHCHQQSPETVAMTYIMFPLPTTDKVAVMTAHTIILLAVFVCHCRQGV